MIGNTGSPSFSLIIPLYNKEKYICHALDSIMAQTCLPKEIIIINDCSTDKGMDIARSHIRKFEHKANFIFSENEINSGPGVSRNRGMELATGDYILFMDADDSLEKDHISNFAECIQRFGSKMLVTRVRRSGSGRILPAENVISQGEKTGANEVRLKCPLSVMKKDILFVSANYCFERKYFEGLFFSSEYNYEDWFFTYQLIRKMALNDEPLWLTIQPTYIYREDDPESLSAVSYNDISRFAIPRVCRELKQDGQKEVLKHIFSIWMFDSLRRLANPLLKWKFLLKFKKDIIANFSTRKFYLAGFLILFFNRKGTEKLISLLR